MKLELNNLATYLPYRLKYLMWNGNAKPIVKELEELRTYTETVFASSKSKPILRPLSDLLKEDYKEELIIFFESLGKDIKITKYDSGNNLKEDFTLTVTYKLIDDVFTEFLINRGDISDTKYYIVEWLLSNHFDIYGLIPKGLAIDVNELNNES